MALSIGLTHAEFWSLSLRELDRLVRVFQRRRQADHEEQVALTAIQTAELVNIVGSAAAGKKWKQVTAKQYFDSWTGKRVLPAMTMDEYKRREAEVEAVVLERVKRQQARRAKAEPGESRPQTDPVG